MQRTALLLGTALLCTPALRSQISFGGLPMGLKAEKLGLPEAPEHRFPAVDVAAQLAEDEARAASGAKGPFHFGVNHPADLSTENSGIWNTLEDGTRIWRIVLHCPQANSINFEFGEYTVPEGAKVFVYNSTGDQLGAFTQASSGGRTQLGVTQLAGDRVTVEYEEPAAVSGQGHLRIIQVTHAYRDVLGLMKSLGASGACNNNVICPEGDPLRDQIASVAMITAGGDGLCTGQLINNCANNGTPYFLTANHCLSQAGGPANWIFRFKWESPTCTPTANGPTNFTVSGSTLLENNVGSDFAMLQLSTTPPSDYNIYYTGWDATGDAPSSTAVVHHPSGDIKKISFDHDAAQLGSFLGAQCWHILAWDDGTTEFGSSGSGLWNPDGRLIGQLYGGEALCGPPESNNVNDYFGRFDLSYPLLTTWLGECGPILDGYDPNAAPLGLDASVFSISGIDATYCDSNVISPVITIKNNGTTPITELTIAYDVDGGTVTTDTWIGNLLAGQTQPVALGDLTMANGQHVFHASCSAPNGGVDENPGNDDKNRGFHVADPGETITLHITTDSYGSETTWEVLAQGGGIVYSGGPYTDTPGGTQESAQFCLEEACFTFVIHDAYDDGICCTYGNGDYSIQDSDGDVLLDGNPQFGTVASTNFCTGTAAIGERGALDGLRIFPNPGDGLFRASLPGIHGPVSFIVRDVTGRELRRWNRAASPTMILDLSDLPNGMYPVEITGAGQRTTRSLMIAR